MKSPSPSLLRHRGAFTLIELLVVIVIIAILVSLSVPVYNLVISKANTLKTKSTMSGLQVAIGHYVTEYNRYPVNPSELGDASGEDMDAILTDGADEGLNPINILMAQTEDASPNMNPRKIKFVDLPQARNGLFGIVEPEGGGSGGLKLMDIWGQPYSIRFDTNYDNRIPNPDKENLDELVVSKATDTVTARSIIYSYGPDKADHTKDDIATWR